VATVNKNFRVKNGLVVEGSTATVNGFDILTKKDADQSYIVNLIGGTATSANEVNKVVKRDASGNFSAGTITASLVGNASTATTLQTARTITLGGDLSGSVSFNGSADVTLNATLANSFATDAEVATAKEQAITAAASDATTKANAAKADAISAAASDATTKANDAKADAISAAQDYADALDTDDVAESAGASNLYFTNGRARSALSAGANITYNSANGVIAVTANSFDAYGAASTAEGNANDYTDAAINALRTDDIEEDASPVNLWFTDARARGAVSAGSGLSYNSGTGVFSVNTETIANKAYVDTAVANLVDSAPNLLNTLNELAAAIGNDANFTTTITNNLATKLSLAGGTLTGALTLHADPSVALHAATKQYVDQAETDAQAAAEATAAAALANVLDGDTDFTALDVNSVSRQVAATTGNIATAEAVTTLLSWNKTNYRTAKVLVKAKHGTHTHVSELIVTLDTSDNIALNEYGITTTNGSLMTIDADIDSGNVRIRVTPVGNNTEVMAHATLLV